MDWILERAMANAGISIGQFNFSDLTYADDVALIDHTTQLHQKYTRLVPARGILPRPQDLLAED